MKEKGKEKRRRRKLRGMNTGMLILLSAALLAVNISVTLLEKQKGWRLDFSFNGITTQSQVTRETLRDLEHPVHVYALFPRGQEDAPLMELLDRYAAASPLFTWEQSDPGLNPALLTRFSTGTQSVSADSLIVYCGETDRWRVLSPTDFVSLSMDEETGTYTYAGYTYERAITNALAYVTRESVPRLTIVQGHGELDGETLRAFDRLMTDNHYQVAYQDLADGDYIPDPSETMFFFSPMRDLTEAELNKVIAFAEAGGSLLFTCDYADPVEDMPNYLALLRSYGFIPLEGLVVADETDANSYYNHIRIDLIPVMQSTDVTMDLVASGADTVLMPGARAFQTPGETDRNLILLSMLQSGDTAYRKSVRLNMSTLEKEDGDPTGPFSLALQAQRMTGEGYVSRAFILGSSGMMTEEQIYAMTDARELIIRMMEYLTGQSRSALNIGARSAVRPALSARGNGTGSLIVTAMPLGVLLAAAIVLWRRKNR